MKKLVIILFFFGSLFSLAGLDLSIFVIDRDLDMPLEGVKIIEADSGQEVYTDHRGIGTLKIPNGTVRAVIITQLIGYEPRKQLVTNFDEQLEIGLLMEGIMEGQELVVEAEAIGETDAEVGVSTVVEKETIKAAAKMGLIEDVMNVVKILPGVTYSGGFGTQVSVRGGDPSGLTAVMDGFTTKFPYHWGGAFSIFNPNIVESIKFSPGVFSAKHGQATSALMEVNTVDPTDGLKFSSILSTSTVEGFAQVPLGKNDEFGILGGFRLTNYEIALAFMDRYADLMNDQETKDTIDPISKTPYIYDFYFKTLYTPSEKFKWHINGFWGNDGVGIQDTADDEEIEDQILHNFDFDFLNSDVFVTTGLKVLPTDKVLLNLVVGYERWEMDVDYNVDEIGTEKYTEDFKLQFADILAPLGSPDSYSLLTESDYIQSTDKHGVQGRFDVDWSLHEKLLIQSGFGSNLEIMDRSSKGTMWMDVDGENGPEYKAVKLKNDVDTTKTLMNFAYVNLNSNIVPELLKFDLGARIDHSYFMGEDDFNLNTYPEVAPRLNITFTPKSNSQIFKDNSFSIGSGLFNKTPFGNGGLRKSFGLDDFELKSEKTLTSVIGWETNLPFDLRFKIEGYYKYMYDRFYFNTIDSGDELEYKLHFDGFGFAYGGDFLLERKTSRYFDGMLTYTFVNARYKDPESDGQENDSYNVRGEYYYPSYHRFHSLNFLMNIKPTPGFTFTTKLSFATGTPEGKDGEKTLYPSYVTDANGNIQIAERSRTATYYSETLRTDFALPLDLKFSWHNYKPNSKIEWEFYFAIQDLLSPALKAYHDRNKDPDEEEEADGSFSFPIPSVGFSLSF